MVKSRAFEKRLCPFDKKFRASIGIIVLKGHLTRNVAPAVKQPPSATNARSPNMQPIAHSNRICKRFQSWRRVAWSRRRCAPNASKHSASLQIKVRFSICIKGHGLRRDFCLRCNTFSQQLYSSRHALWMFENGGTSHKNIRTSFVHQRKRLTINTTVHFQPGVGTKSI